MKTFETSQLTEQQAEGAILDDEIKRGIAASEAGDKGTAETIFRRIVAERPETLEAWIWLGWTSSSLDSSEDAFTRASALDPHNEEAKLGLRWVATQRGPSQPAAEPQTPEKAATLEAPAPAVSALPENWTLDVAMRRAVSASRAGDKHGAYAMFREIADKHPDLPAVWVWCGGTSPSLEAAEFAFNNALRLDPTNEEANLGLRWVALRRQIERQGATSNMDVATPVSYPNSTRTIANLGGDANASIAMLDHSEPRAVETKESSDAAPAKQTSSFAKFLKKLNVPWPVILLIVAVIIVYAVAITLYLSSPTH